MSYIDRANTILNYPFLKAFRHAWRDTKTGFKTKGLKFFLLWLLFAVTTGILIGKYDEQTVVDAREFTYGWLTKEHLQSIAKVIHDYGDFVFFNLGFCGLLLIIGKLRSNSYSIRVATTLLLAGIIAGTSVLAIKLSTGRPRPPLVQKGLASAWEFKGPTFSTKHRSYPSGHATSVATAMTVLALAFPRLIPAALIIAVIAGASRVIYNYHFPTDVLHGLAYGMTIGSLCSHKIPSLRRRLRRKAQLSASVFRQKTSSTQELSPADHP